MDRADGNGSWNLIATVNLTDDYNTYQVALPDLIGSKRYGQIAFAAQYNNAAVIEDGEITNPGDFIYLDNIRIGDFIFTNHPSLQASQPIHHIFLYLHIMRAARIVNQY